MSVRRALLLAVLFEVVMLGFSVGLTRDADATGRRWALAGAVLGVVAGVLMAWKAAATLRSGAAPRRRRGADIGPAAGAAVGLAAAIFLGDDLKLAILWFATTAIGVAVAGAAYARSRLSG